MTGTLTVRTLWAWLIDLPLTGPLTGPLTTAGGYLLVAGVALLVASAGVSVFCWIRGDGGGSDRAELGLWVCRWGLLCTAAGLLCWAVLALSGPVVPWESAFWRLGIALALLWLWRRWRRWAYLAFPGLRRRYLSEVYYLQQIAEYVEKLERDRLKRSSVRTGPPGPGPLIGRQQRGVAP
jgi:hypothetical protein